MKTAKKAALIIAAVLTAVGFFMFSVGFISSGFDLSFMMEKTEVRTVDIAKDITDISVMGTICDVKIMAAEGEDCKVAVRESKKIGYDVTFENGKLTVRENNRKRWYDYIGFGFVSTEVLVYLPAGEYGNLNIETDTGDVHISEGISLSNARIMSDIGDIEVLSAVTNDVWFDTDTGKITAKGLGRSNNHIISSSTGDITLERIECKQIQLDSDTGDVRLSDVVCTDKLNVETDTGDVLLQSCDAGAIHIETDTGDVTANLLSEMIVYAESDTGKVDIPRGRSGGVCEIESDTGDIYVEFAAENSK